jgi:hypothetical protein
MYVLHVCSRRSLTIRSRQLHTSFDPHVRLHCPAQRRLAELVHTSLFYNYVGSVLCPHSHSLITLPREVDPLTSTFSKTKEYPDIHGCHVLSAWNSDAVINSPHTILLRHADTFIIYTDADTPGEYISIIHHHTPPYPLYTTIPPQTCPKCPPNPTNPTKKTARSGHPT